MTPPIDSGAPKIPDPFEFLKTLWSPMGLPLPGLVTPTMDVGEIEKRISDLKSVENWLNLNLNVLRMTIQGLEMQRATLSAMQGGMTAAARVFQPPAASADGRAASPSPAEAWWTVLQQAQKAAEQAAAQVADQAAARASNDPGTPDQK